MPWQTCRMDEAVDRATQYAVTSRLNPGAFGILGPPLSRRTTAVGVAQCAALKGRGN